MRSGFSTLTPFSATAQAPAQEWWAKLLRRPDTKGARAALERQLARAQNASLAPGEADVLLATHRVTGRAAREITSALWQKAFRACVADSMVTESEVEFLRRLQRSLGMSDVEMDEARAAASRALYSSAVREAVADGEVTRSEQQSLDALANALSLNETERLEIAREPLAEALQKVLGETVSDRRVSPAEQTRLHQLAARLGATEEYTRTIGPQLQKFILLWRIENEALPVIPVGINLQKGEVCHCQFAARWLEMRTHTVRTYRTGPVASIRIVKGLHYRIGSYQTHRVTANELTQIDAGTAYVTNKRLIFDGQAKNSTIRHSAVIALQPYSDGVGIEKGSGRSPVLVTSDDAEIITAIYSEALNRAT
jgi:tellurite resistance protein